jgi:hypothetical protein
LASLIAPTSATTPTAIPMTPVMTFPLSRQITQSTRLIAMPAIDDHHSVVPKPPVTKLAPPISAPVITRTQKIASTDCRPCLAQ